MKKFTRVITFVLMIIASVIAQAQEIPISTEQQLENQTDADQVETEDDSYLQELDRFRKHPLDLNSADAEELKQLRVVTDLQIANLVAYRNFFGKLLSIYELQAVPSWDINTIRKLLPFVTTVAALPFKEELKLRFRNGNHQLLLRISQTLERSAGFNRANTGTQYLGSPQRIFFRYRYNYKNLLQFGLTGDKDAGEQFLKGAQRKGFDFYSFHLFARKIGIIHSLALGDFSVSMGQGLILWQGLAFRKSAEVRGVKRQSATLRPYTSAGEFYFQRGAGITIKKGRIESTVFMSLRKLDGNFITDTVNDEHFVSSFLTSGYHRTGSEIADKNKVSQTAAGASIIYRGMNCHVGVNGIYYKFSVPIVKRNDPYNLYAINGDKWSNISIDYSYTYKNIHVFGEVATDKNFNKAFINGLLASVDPRVDISLVQRTISKAFQSINANAFTENTLPNNETGFYAGIVLRPAIGWKIDLYGDIYKFPWLKFRVDAPAHGKDYLMQLTYTPTRHVELYTRFRNETRQTNASVNTTTTHFIVSIPKQSWRTQVSYKWTSSLALRNRVELLWYDKRGVSKELGFLGFTDIVYKPLLSPFSGILRFQYFETGGYNSRIYAYENDVLYSYSIPAFADRGFRYYLNINYDLAKNISCWFRWAQTVYQGKDFVGSGPDEIPGNRRTELRFQVRWQF